MLRKVKSITFNLQIPQKLSHLILLAFCAKNFNLHFTEATCWVFLLILYDAAIIVAQCVHMYHIFKLGLIFLKQDTLWVVHGGISKCRLYNKYLHLLFYLQVQFKDYWAQTRGPILEYTTKHPICQYRTKATGQGPILAYWMRGRIFQYRTKSLCSIIYILSLISSF